tara:strand:- start:102 stop:401 length:300 start_codon:yes stop_codon:yes gene_type:complete
MANELTFKVIVPSKEHGHETLTLTREPLAAWVKDIDFTRLEGDFYADGKGGVNVAVGDTLTYSREEFMEEVDRIVGLRDNGEFNQDEVEVRVVTPMAGG